jgi:hypothetical protein
MRKGAIRLKANTCNHVICVMMATGSSPLYPCPLEAQMSELCGITVDDFDGDGNLDVAISGNDYGTEVTTGRTMHLMA